MSVSSVSAVSGVSAVSAVRAALDGLLDALAALDVALLDTGVCAELVPLLARSEKLCRLRKAQAAARATSGGGRGLDGSPDGAHWLARQSGESVGAARADLDTVGGLADCPATARAVAAGDLSLDQAKEIASAVHVNPAVEEELVELARHAPMSSLRDEARRRRHEVADPDDLHRRQHAARRFRSWQNELGNIAFAGEAPPEIGVPFIARLQAQTDRLWRRARAASPAHDVEPRDAYALDALMAMTAGQGRGRATRADVVIVCDLRAWRRGHAEPGEPCHVVGAGRVPVSVAKTAFDDPFVKAVVHDGVDVRHVLHLGRHMPAELRTALELGAPPTFPGVACRREGCGRREGLQWDHIDPVAHLGPTAYDNLQPLCFQHHQEKTDLDRLAGLLRPRPKGADP